MEVKDGKRKLIWRQDQLTTNSGFTPSEQVVAADIDSVVYLRASVTYGSSNTQFYYSLDNKTYTPIGEQTHLGFNLTVFVGARFGLFCYATEAGRPGYADFDWFSTETNFDEATFYPADFAGYSADMLTIDKIEADAEQMEVMIGRSIPLTITATYRDGHTENMAAKAKYTISSTDIAEVQNGQIRGLSEGQAELAATVADLMGNEFTTTFHIRSTFFPFGKEYINTSLFSQGTYDEKTHTFHPGQWGQMGWEYPNGADMSAYKYLVIKLKKTQNCDAHLNIFTGNSIWGSCYATAGFGSKKQIVVNLQTAKYTSGDDQGKKLDTKNIHIVDFWSNGTGDIVVDDIYLTNNSDYSPTAINEVKNEESRIEDAAMYDLSGRRLSTTPLRPGLYIKGGRKVVIK